MVKQYQKKRKSYLEIGENRIVLSHPEVQAWNEFHYESKADILYYYYTIRIQMVKRSCMVDFKDGVTPKKKKIWKTIVKDSVYENGMIPYLEEFLDVMMALDTYPERHYFYEETEKESKTDYIESVTRWITGICQEDVWMITKFHKHVEPEKEREEWEKELYGIEEWVPDSYWYQVTFEIGNELKQNTVGFSCNSLTDADLETIKAWCHGFLEITKEVTQEKIEGWFQSDQDEYSCDPAWFRDHMKEQYPEDFPKWKEIWVKLYEDSRVLEEYRNYVKGNPIPEPLKIKEKNPYTVQEEIQRGKKDWEAYCDFLDIEKEKRRNSFLII